MVELERVQMNTSARRVAGFAGYSKFGISFNQSNVPVKTCQRMQAHIVMRTHPLLIKIAWDERRHLCVLLKTFTNNSYPGGQP